HFAVGHGGACGSADSCDAVVVCAWRAAVLREAADRQCDWPACGCRAARRRLTVRTFLLVLAVGLFLPCFSPAVRRRSGSSATANCKQGPFNEQTWGLLCDCRLMSLRVRLTRSTSRSRLICRLAVLPGTRT